MLFCELLPDHIAFAPYGGTELSLLNFKTGNVATHQAPYCEASAIASSPNFLVVGLKSASVNIYEFSPFLSEKGKEKGKKLLEQIGSVQTYRAEVPCVAISESFHSVVCGTADGYLVYASLPKCAVLKAVGIKAVPSRLMVTKAWGLTVACARVIESGRASDFLIVLDADGKEIRRKELEAEIVAWECYQTNDGFDRMMVGDSRGRVFGFDVYSLEMGNPIGRCHFPIVAIKMIPRENIMCVIQNDGTINTFSVTAASSFYA